MDRSTAEPRSLDTAVESWALRTPDATAIIDGHRSVSYRELDRQANRLAHHLDALGVRTDTAVGLLVERSADFIIAALAVLKCGAHYVPLSAELPKGRSTAMLEENDIRVVITQRSPLGPLGAGSPRTVFLDEGSELVGRCPPTSPGLPADPDRAAYVLYTSGTTGRPKGIAVPHRGVLRLGLDPGYLDVSTTDRFLLHSSLLFDLSVFEIWVPLLNGATVVVLGPRQPTLAQLAGAVERDSVTTAWFTVSLFNQLVLGGFEQLGGLRNLLFGGEAAAADIVREAARRYPRTRLINGYGPTECTVFSTCHTVTPADTAAIPIGKPIARTYVRVLSADLAPTPPGTPGELCVGGDGLALGYVGQPEATAAAFVPDPHRPGATIYRTGDLVVEQPGGELLFIGRIDSQVKIRGFRVEPGEVEQALRHHRSIDDAVVVKSAADDSLSAYLVPSRLPLPSVLELLGFLRERLAPFMIPSTFLAIDRVPLTGSGKVDRPALDMAAQPLTSPIRVPPDLHGLEARVALIWQNVMGLELVDVDSDFFLLGGHSIDILRILNAVKATWNVEIDVEDFLSDPTVGALARNIGARHADCGRSALSGPD